MLGRSFILGVSLIELFNIVSNVWYVEIIVQSIIDNIPRWVDNDSEVYLLKSLKNFYVWIEGCAQLDAISPYWFKNSFVQQQFSFDR